MKIISLEEIDGGDLPDANTSERRDPVPARQPRLEVVCMANVPPVSIEWLWPNRIAVGKVSILAGNGGIGKSTILCDWAAG
jgi:putative DNA primase/helicase